MKIRWTARSVRVQVPPPAPTSRCPRFEAEKTTEHHWGESRIQRFGRGESTRVRGLRSFRRRSLNGGALEPTRSGLKRSRAHISSGGRNAEIYLRARIQLTQDRQLTAYKLGAFTHALQAVVSLAPISSKKLRVDTVSVIS